MKLRGLLFYEPPGGYTQKLNYQYRRGYTYRWSWCRDDDILGLRYIDPVYQPWTYVRTES